MVGRVVDGRPIKVRRVQPTASLDGLHVLFIDSSVEQRAVDTMLTAAQGQAVLTVCDAPDATAQGCMIGFVMASDRLRFDVGLAWVVPSGLRINARMLVVAHRVWGAL